MYNGRIFSRSLAAKILNNPVTLVRHWNTDFRRFTHSPYTPVSKGPSLRLWAIDAKLELGSSQSADLSDDAACETLGTIWSSRNICDKACALANVDYGV
jgi:hypothetical protein